HVPGSGGTTLGAKAAMDTEVLVLEHEALRLRQRTRGENVLLLVQRGHGQSLPERRLLSVLGDGEALQRADVDASVTLDAEPVGEDRFDVAVQAPLDFSRRLLRREAELDLDVEALESLDEVDVRHLLAFGGVVVVAVAPLVD